MHYITWQLPAPEVNDCCLLRSSCQVKSSRRVFLPKLAAGETVEGGKEVQMERMEWKYKIRATPDVLKRQFRLFLVGLYEVLSIFGV